MNMDKFIILDGYRINPSTTFDLEEGMNYWG